MAGNFNSFDPVTNLTDKFSDTIFISAQDRLEEIVVGLKAKDCQHESQGYEQWDWPPLSLAGFHYVTMFIKRVGSDELDSEIIGVPMQPLEDGNVIFRVSGAAFGGEVGEYIGLVEVRYKASDRSGDRIVTARNYIPFEVREDFYCDPFGDYFEECSGRK